MFWHVLVKKLMTVFVGKILFSTELDEGEALPVLLVNDPALVCTEVLAYQLDVGVHHEGNLWVDVVRGAQQAQGRHFTMKEFE